MQKQLDYLIQLQKLDQLIDQTLDDSSENPKKIEQIDQEIENAREIFQTFIREMDELKKQRRDLEREVEEFEAKIKKSQVKLMEVKTNKEYRAMLTEVEDIKRGKAGKEDLLLEYLEKTEEGIQKEKNLKKSVESKIAEGNLKRKELGKEALGYEERLTDLNRKRKELTALIDPGLLKQYEFLKERLKGIAVAEAREAACRGCHMQIPPQLYNELHRQDRIITCPSCLRILYLVEPIKKKKGEEVCFVEEK
jgi:uncharacterized protein